MKNAFENTIFSHSNIEKVYKGKVRDVYNLSNGEIAMIVSDRISAFDHILPRPIPHKGAVLNEIAQYFLQNTSDIVPNWLSSSPDPNISIGLHCEPIKLEMVVRGYLVGHAWREYDSGKRVLCGVELPEGLIKNQKFESPIITPATKADEGHDEDISEQEILNRKIVTVEVWNKLKEYTLKLFQRGTEMAAKRGLILVDTKYEFGISKVGDIVLIDEIHTPDSSRYFYLDGYEKRQNDGVEQVQLSKEFVREWLMEQGFQGKDGQKMPVMNDELVQMISDKYIQLYEIIIGKPFVKYDGDVTQRIKTNFITYLDSL
jgi:phosphoribosylaminoimidazole-succinocarboxamide synthase